MADVLTGEHFDVCKSYTRCDIRERINHDCKSEVMSTPLDPYFRRRIVSLWKRGEYLFDCRDSAHGRAENDAEDCEKVDLPLARTARLARQASKWPSTKNNA